MPAPGAGIHDFPWEPWTLGRTEGKSWMAGLNPAMTKVAKTKAAAGAAIAGRFVDIRTVS